MRPRPGPSAGAAAQRRRRRPDEKLSRLLPLRARARPGGDPRDHPGRSEATGDPERRHGAAGAAAPGPHPSPNRTARPSPDPGAVRKPGSLCRPEAALQRAGARPSARVPQTGGGVPGPPGGGRAPGRRRQRRRFRDPREPVRPGGGAGRGDRDGLRHRSLRVAPGRYPGCTVPPLPGGQRGGDRVRRAARRGHPGHLSRTDRVRGPWSARAQRRHPGGRLLNRAGQAGAGHRQRERRPGHGPLPGDAGGQGPLREGGRHPRQGTGELRVPGAGTGKRLFPAEGQVRGLLPGRGGGNGPARPGAPGRNHSTRSRDLTAPIRPWPRPSAVSSSVPA